MGLVFSQVCLLAIWGGLGTSPWWMLIPGTAVGTSCACVLACTTLSVAPSGYCLHIGPWGYWLGFSEQTFVDLSVFAAFMVTVFLIMCRLTRATIRRNPPPVDAVSRIQFSIRQLLIVTFATACLITICKAHPPSRFLHQSLLVFVAFGSVGVVSVWILATTRPFLDGVLLVAFGAFAGYQYLLAGGSPAITVITAFTIEALSMAISLLVVRSCDYRLARLPARRPTVRSP